MSQLNYKSKQSNNVHSDEHMLNIQLTGHADVDLLILSNIPIDDLQSIYVNSEYARSLLADNTIDLIKQNNNMPYSSAQSFESFLQDYNNVNFTDRCLSFHSLEECLTKSIKENNLEGLENLLSNKLNTEIFNELPNKLSNVNTINYNNIAYVCAEYNNFDAFKIVMDFAPDDYNFYYDKLVVISLANSTGNIDFFDETLKLDCNFDYNYIAKYIAEDENIYLLKYLINIVRDDYEFDHNAIAATSAKTGNENFLYEIMDIFNERGHSGWNYEHIIYEAFASGNSSLAKKLFSSFGNVNLNMVAKDLIIKNKQDIVVKLLETYKNYIWNILDLETLAIQFNRKNLLEFLIASYKDNDYTKLMETVILYNRNNLIDVLLNTTFVDWNFSKLLETALANNFEAAIYILIILPTNYKLDYHSIINHLPNNYDLSIVQLIYNFAKSSGQFENLINSMLKAGNSLFIKNITQEYLNVEENKDLNDFLLAYENFGSTDLSQTLFELYRDYNWDFDKLISIAIVEDNYQFANLITTHIPANFEWNYDAILGYNALYDNIYFVTLMLRGEYATKSKTEQLVYNRIFSSLPSDYYWDYNLIASLAAEGGNKVLLSNIFDTTLNYDWKFSYIANAAAKTENYDLVEYILGMYPFYYTYNSIMEDAIINWYGYLVIALIKKYPDYWNYDNLLNLAHKSRDVEIINYLLHVIKK